MIVVGSISPACESGPVEKSLTEKYNCMVDIEDIEEGEEAPVILKNNPFSTNMEGIVESYGLPHAGEIDPTTIMSSISTIQLYFSVKDFSTGPDSHAGIYPLITNVRFD